MKFTARSRLETYASISRVQSDEETYGLRALGMDSSGARSGDTASDYRALAGSELPERRRDMEVSVPSPSGYLVQMTSKRNPPHGWAVHLLRGEHVDGAVPFYLSDVVEALRKECERAWREVDFIAKERTEHLEWRTMLANDLDECERMRDALGIQLNKYHAVYSAANALMARLGHDGTIDTNSPLVETLMNALDEVDGSTKGWL